MPPSQHHKHHKHHPVRDFFRDLRYRMADAMPDILQFKSEADDINAQMRMGETLNGLKHQIYDDKHVRIDNPSETQQRINSELIALTQEALKKGAPFIAHDALNQAYPLEGDKKLRRKLEEKAYAMAAKMKR